MHDSLSSIDKISTLIDETLDKQRESSKNKKNIIDAKLDSLLNEMPYE